MRTRTRGSGPFLRRVQIRNYRSIGHCAVELAPLTLLVGRNGAGKSNFLDALSFIADSLQGTLDHAIKVRGGVDSVRRRSTGHPRNFAIEVEMQTATKGQMYFGFEIAARSPSGFVVKREDLAIWGRDTASVSYSRRENQIKAHGVGATPPVVEDRLYLVNAAGLPQFREAYEALISMGFYNLNPESMRELQSPDAGELLHRDGSNIASVLARLAQDQPEIVQRIEAYLTAIVPEISRVERISLGPRETLQFKQRVVGAKAPWKFYATSMSDGTLRALGALVAVAQLAESDQAASLVGIEEPETALHPAAAGALMDALREASVHTQILLTTHSPDLLDVVDVDEAFLLAVVTEAGKTSIAPIDPASREVIRKHLYTAGDLLRMDQLQPDPEDLERQSQIRLFEPETIPA
jgi:predicted ATPase